MKMYRAVLKSLFVAIILIPSLARATTNNAGDFGGSLGRPGAFGGAGTNSGVVIGTSYACVDDDFMLHQNRLL